MKKVSSLFIFVILLLSFTAQSQLIINADFEDWCIAAF